MRRRSSQTGKPNLTLGSDRRPVRTTNKLHPQHSTMAAQQGSNTPIWVRLYYDHGNGNYKADDGNVCCISSNDIENQRVDGLAKAARTRAFPNAFARCDPNKIAFYPPSKIKEDGGVVASVKPFPSAKFIRGILEEYGSSWNSENPTPL